MNELQTQGDPQSQAPTLMGERPTRFAVGGRIRAGIKVLTPSAAREPAACAIYASGIAAGRSFDEIEAEIARTLPEIRHPLVPKNVPYFTVRRGDFATPELADLILNKFGEAREDGVRRLYRFPVVFPADAWPAVMPHALMCYGAKELKYWSAYSADGRERYCMTFERVPLDAGGKRAIRIFGGRKHVPRAENDGRCDPESCPEYQARQCNLSGRFLFLIPGIPSLNVIELATNSFYAMNAARQTLETVGFLRGGRISGFLEGRASFWITKKRHEVAMIDEQGEPSRVPQWLIELEAPVDLARLLRIEGDETRLAAAERAVAILNGSAKESREEASTLPPPMPQAGDEEEDGAARERLACANGIHEREAASTSGTALDGDDPLAALYALVAALRVPRDKFDRYAKRRYGAGWSRNPTGVRRVATAVASFKSDGNGLRAAIDAELDLFTPAK